MPKPSTPKRLGSNVASLPQHYECPLPTPQALVNLSDLSPTASLHSVLPDSPSVSADQTWEIQNSISAVRDQPDASQEDISVISAEPVNNQENLPVAAPQQVANQCGNLPTPTNGTQVVYYVINQPQAQSHNLVIPSAYRQLRFPRIEERKDSLGCGSRFIVKTLFFVGLISVIIDIVGILTLIGAEKFKYSYLEILLYSIIWTVFFWGILMYDGAKIRKAKAQRVPV